MKIPTQEWSKLSGFGQTLLEPAGLFFRKARQHNLRGMNEFASELILYLDSELRPSIKLTTALTLYCSLAMCYTATVAQGNRPSHAQYLL